MGRRNFPIFSVFFVFLRFSSLFFFVFFVFLCFFFFCFLRFFSFSLFFFVFLRLALILSEDKGKRLQFTAKMGNFTPTPSAPTPCKTSRLIHKTQNLMSAIFSPWAGGDFEAFSAGRPPYTKMSVLLSGGGVFGFAEGKGEVTILCVWARRFS